VVNYDYVAVYTAYSIQYIYITIYIYIYI
jgi:hypothetical protein